MPCLLRPTNAPALPPPLLSRVPEVSQKLASASTQLSGPPSDRIQGAATIESMIRERKPDADWSAARLAVQATRTTWGLVEPAQTRSLIQLGLEWEPANAELQYFARILDREKPSVGGISAVDK